MATTAPMFLELDQEERERELEQLEEQLNEQDSGEKSIDHDQEYQKKGKRTLLNAEKGHLLKLINSIHERPNLVNFADPDGYTPLHRASYGGHLDCVKYLVRHGANLEAKTNDGWRPLHCAARWNNLEVADFLVASGADINATSSGDNTPLHIVASNGCYSLTCDFIQLLLFQPDCDYHIRNQSGDTAFDIAKRSSSFHRFWVGVHTLSDHQLLIDEDDAPTEEQRKSALAGLKKNTNY